MRTLLRLLTFIAAPVLAAAASFPLDEVIQLPEFKVFEDRPLPAREKWDYTRVGNFEILSNTSQRVTKEFAKDLTDFQIVLGIVAPHMLIRAEQPVMIVLCGRNNAFAKFEVKPTVKSTRGRGTSLVRDNEIAAIVVDYETRTVNNEVVVNLPDGNGSWFTDFFTQNDIHASEEFIRQYIHLSLSQLHPRPPAWVAEGLANIYRTIDYNNKWIEIGRPRAFISEITVSPSFANHGFSSMGGGFGGYNSYDGGFGRFNDFGGSSSYGGYGNYSGFGGYGGSYDSFGSFGRSYRLPMTIMSMDKMLAVDYESPLLKGSASRHDTVLNSWQRQVTAFVHMCLYGRNTKYRDGFVKFAARTATEPPTEALFKECFGVSYKDMTLTIRGYTEFTDYTGKIIKATKGGILYPRPPVTIRAANDAEIGRIKGETLRLAGQDEAARREFVVAYLRGERDPQLLASLGLMARQRQDDARARTYLEAVGVAATPVPRPRAYLELARLRGAAQVAKTGAQPLTSDQVVELLTPLFVAQRLPQQLAPIYLEIAGVWERSSIAPTSDNLGALNTVSAFSPTGELILRTAALLIKHGHKADAAAMIQRALSATRDPELRAKFEALRQKIDAPPVSRTEAPTRIPGTS